jgi:hypothetical protein
VTESQPPLKPIPGEQVQASLHQYAEKNDLLSRIRFGSKVVKAERRAGEEGGLSGRGRAMSLNATS